MNIEELAKEARAVLTKNDRGSHTVPVTGLYTHQWLWDSCFIAIGLRHYDIDRAQTEILNLLRGQWSNGMLPHMIYADSDKHRRDKDLWRSWLSPFAPEQVATSGITQPPMLAEAITQIGKKLTKSERRVWYQNVYPALLTYHLWLYNERDPHGEGLTLQIHPWETGLDNTPPWMHELHEHQLPLWIRVLDKLGVDKMGSLFRRDTYYAAARERLSNIDGLAFFSMQRRLRRKAYDINKILSHSLLVIEDLTFNCIFIRANTHLRAIAKEIGKELAPDLLACMKKSEEALEQLWDAYSAQYYSREHVTHKLIKIPSIAALMPLYAGCITKEHADVLAKNLYNPQTFGTDYPIPSVPKSSAWFDSKKYWQGPTWMNTNWLVIDGLRRYKYHELAEAVSISSIEMVQTNGFNEYFDPLDASPCGVENFSWTAALCIDLMATTKSIDGKAVKLGLLDQSTAES